MLRPRRHIEREGPRRGLRRSLCGVSYLDGECGVAGCEGDPERVPSGLRVRPFGKAAGSDGPGVRCSASGRCEGGHVGCTYRSVGKAGAGNRQRRQDLNGESNGAASVRCSTVGCLDCEGISSSRGRRTGEDPAAVRFKPGGRLPVERVQLYGVVPPVAANVTEYGTATIPDGIVAVVIWNVHDGL